MENMKNLYVLGFQENGKNLFGGHSTDINDFADISIIKEKKPKAENFIVKIFQFDPSQLVKYREDMEHPMFWFKIDIATDEIVGLEFSFEEMQRLDFKEGHRYLGVTLSDEDTGLIWKKQ